MEVMRKVEGTGDQEMYSFYCPACEKQHYVKTKGPGAKWQFNGDTRKPTVSPSLKISQPWKDETTICHFFIRDRKIQYCGDCTHDMAGKTVDMVDVDSCWS